MSWKTHIDNVKRTETIAIIRLYAVVRNEHLKPTIKLLIYASVIRTVLTYDMSTWGCAANTNINKIQVIQNRILRIITSASWFISNVQIRRDLVVPSIRQHMKAATSKIIERAEKHENENVGQLNYNIQACRV